MPLDTAGVVGAVLVDSLAAPTRLLAARRTSPVELAGRWEFPGGKVEPGETAEAALVREIREELGVSVRLGEELRDPRGRPWPISPTLEMRVWFASCGSQTPRAAGSHDAVRWISPNDWHTIPWLDADLPIVLALEESGLFS
jgi:8-oxo-dGTP diphosphatase